MKRCIDCGTLKAPKEFRRSKKWADGREGRCSACARIKAAKYRDANREAIRAGWRAWRATHPEQRQRARQWRQENAATMREYRWAWDLRNPQKAAANHRRQVDKRYALTRGAPHGESIDRQAIYERDGGVCHLCDQPVPRERFHLEHVWPVSLGGTHTPDNVKIAHPSCNSRKGNRGGTVQVMVAEPSGPMPAEVAEAASEFAGWFEAAVPFGAGVKPSVFLSVPRKGRWLVIRL